MNLDKAQRALDEDPEYGVWFMPTGAFLGWYGRAVIYAIWTSPSSLQCPLGTLDICTLEEAKREGRPIERKLDLAIPPGPVDLITRLWKATGVRHYPHD